MPFPERLPGGAEASHAEPERSGESTTESDGSDELADADLEEVLGGLERIHFPDVIELPELDA